MNYLDNASTSYPKPRTLTKYIKKYIKKNGMSGGRTFSKKGIDVLTTVYETREMLAKLVNYKSPKSVIFTSGATESINVILKGYLKKGEHVIISNFEHNSVIRTVTAIDGLEYSILNIASDNIKQEAIRLIKENTKAIVLTHASNITGEIFEIEKIKDICKANNIKLIIDATQSIGAASVDMEELGADALIFTGHKSLLGPVGIGGFIIKEDFAKEVNSLINGGTGSNSRSLIQPNIIPDKFECGTQNFIGIFGLNAILKYLKKYGFDKINAHHNLLKEYLISELNKLDNIKILRKKNLLKTVGIVSFYIEDNKFNIDRLLNDFTKKGIIIRSGLHCTPLGHQSLQTTKHKVIRVSFSIYNTKKDIDKLIDILKVKLKKEAR